MILSRAFLVMILASFSLVVAETPFNWGKEEMLASRLVMKQQALQSTQTEDTLFHTAPPAGKKLSVKKAVIFSGILPGSGQFYAKSYVKTALFVAVEAAAWAINISYQHKGDQKDSEFKDYANAHWAEYRYWSYVNWDNRGNDAYAGLLVPENLWVTVNHEDGRVWYLIDEGYYRANQASIVNNLRQVEQQEYSHRLPPTRTQQYYEMIGKYPVQFGNAWDDATFNRTYSGPDNITPNNNYYMEMRDESNHYYDMAQYGIMVALINHVVSAIDAGFTARNYNRQQAKLEASYHNYRYRGEYVNMFGVNVIW